MLLSETNCGCSRLPDGYVVIPLQSGKAKASLGIGVLVKKTADPVGGNLVLLKSNSFAAIYLGCIYDAEGRILDWLELWVQQTSELIDTPVMSRHEFTNASLDDRWCRQVQAFQMLPQTLVVKTGWESVNPLPMFLDLNARTCTNPMDSESGANWQLCTDEGLLEQKGLPAYGASMFRYLYIPVLGTDSSFASVTSNAPQASCTVPLSQVLGNESQLLPFNPAAAFMMAKKYHPLDLEAFINILGQSPGDFAMHGTTALEPIPVTEFLSRHNVSASIAGRLFLESSGRCGMLAEIFHLKLRLLAELVSSVQQLIGLLKRPLFTLSPGSWRIDLPGERTGLPSLWTTRAVLTDPGDAIPLTIKGTDSQYYLSSSSSGTSVYRPISASLPVSGRALVRIRRVLTEEAGPTIVEGTFASQQRLELASRDIVWMPLHLGSGPVDLYAHLESDTALAQGEWRFRTVGQHMDETKVAALQAAEGVPLPDIQFDTVPLLSSPVDMYSLAVLATRILLVDDTNTLPVAVDEIMSLGREAAACDASAALEDRIMKLFGDDSRWLNSLGPHHLMLNSVPAQEALEIIPSGLWWQTLAIVLRMFPSLGPDSHCVDYGDAPRGAIQKVFDDTILSLENLIIRTRSLIVGDWKSNQRIHDVIGEYLERDTTAP